MIFSLSNINDFSLERIIFLNYQYIRHFHLKCSLQKYDCCRACTLKYFFFFIVLRVVSLYNVLIICCNYIFFIIKKPLLYRILRKYFLFFLEYSTTSPSKIDVLPSLSKETLFAHILRYLQINS